MRASCHRTKTTGWFLYAGLSRKDESIGCEHIPVATHALYISFVTSVSSIQNASNSTSWGGFSLSFALLPIVNLPAGTRCRIIPSSAETLVFPMGAGVVGITVDSGEDMIVGLIGTVAPSCVETEEVVSIRVSNVNAAAVRRASAVCVIEILSRSGSVACKYPIYATAIALTTGSRIASTCTQLGLRSELSDMAPPTLFSRIYTCYRTIYQFCLCQFPGDLNSLAIIKV